MTITEQHQLWAVKTRPGETQEAVFGYPGRAFKMPVEDWYAAGNPTSVDVTITVTPSG